MKITCSDCRKIFNIPDKRLQAYKTDITIPCPACNGKIEISPVKMREASTRNNTTSLYLNKTNRKKSSDPLSSVQDTSKADQLKKKILQKVKDLPPMPRVVLS